MILHTHECIFIHIPKAAGSSIALALDEHNKTWDEQRSGLPFLPDALNKFGPPAPHFRVSDYLKYGMVTKEEFNSYFKFSFVRNPWDRLVSEYKYRGHAMRWPFKDFLFKYFPVPSWTDEYCHIIPQYDFLYDENGRLLVDFIGKFETLQEDFNEVCRRLNLMPRELPYTNRALSVFKIRSDAGLVNKAKKVKGLLSIKQKKYTFKHYTQYYDGESKAFVAKLYQKDIEAFGYRFEGLLPHTNLRECVSAHV
ncbi:MAG: sulfotransferase family protein [Candidatus Brocadiaceae bacterium]|nr:sulfotransferase family protein [Candidatus Brocadiaceae bacterium]